MSGMDRLTDEALDRRANTALSGLGPVHGRLMTEGYEGSANAVMDAADVIRELLAHRRASQAAPAPSDGLREAAIPDYDAGLLNDYGGGDTDWWQDYIRAEIGRANDYWRAALSTPTEER